tara:strand:- start:3758 stop:4423 length:666 start_codon:yes stop_codon:yes gene_type:complete
MRSFVFLLSLVIQIFLASHVIAQGWIEFVDDIDSFGVNFPGQPEIEEFSYISEFNAVFPGRTYTAEAGNNHYSVTVVDFSDAARIHESMDRTEAGSGPSNWLYDQRASVARAARQFREREGEVTYDAWSHIDRVEGLQLQLSNSDGSRTFAGIYLNGNVDRLYVLEATVDARSPSPGLFQQSLHFLDDGGERIRYRLSTNGCSVHPDIDADNPAIAVLSIR